eukprot:TRINITY_DN66829_c0_g1_i1.p2 TRINITY_DN66829_c0_g1~~TRINITY_DN66829_c0_g1_i1.p2  ORF type:complete len:161 (+),score=42.02 TRINITY_DN66829_c0_g1_i1:253-735(+)
MSANSDLDTLCADLMQGMKSHKQRTGADPWPAAKVVDVDLSTGAGVAGVEESGESMADLLDAFDDMIDSLTGAPGGQPAVPAQREGGSAQESADQPSEGLEDLVRQAMQQIRDHGLPAPKQQSPDEAQGGMTVHSTAGPGATVDVPDDIAAQLDALGDLL